MPKKKEAFASPFVPEEEQPYPIPENWCWTNIESINQYSGLSVDPMKQPDTIFELYSVPSSADDYPEIIAGSEIGSSKQSAIKNDVLLCKINPRINRVWKVSQHTDNALLASSEWIIIRNSIINPDYLMLCFRSQYFREFMLSNVSGVGGSLMRAQPKFVKKYPVPIAPIAEQHRIVTRIESLFSKLDEAKEKAQAVVDGFELRKSAILHKAFIGELTERWRKEHGVGMDSWETKRINEIAKPRAGYAFDSKKFTNSGYQIIRMGNLYGGELDLSRNPVFIPLDDVDETALKRSLVNNGDILITLTGTKYKRDYGYAVSIIDPINLLVNQRILCLTPSQDMERNYILYYLRSNIFRDVFFSNETGGVNQGNVSSKFVENIEIKVPSYAEQHEIVTILDRIMTKEQQAKEAAEAVLSQIDTMKKAILTRAFRGELGSNDPVEEWAGEMLKHICQSSWDK